MTLLYKVLYNKGQHKLYASVGLGLFYFIILMNVIVVMEMIFRTKIVVSNMKSLGAFIIIGFSVLIYYMVAPKIDRQLPDSRQFEVRKIHKLIAELLFLGSIALVMGLAILRQEIFKI